jgi:hypothetical protein
MRAMRQVPKRGLRDVDPLCLPVGTRIGPWRVEAWRDRGTSGTLYRVVRAGWEQQGPFALKLAMHPEDERFKREGWLLGRVHSEYVPRLDCWPRGCSSRERTEGKQRLSARS